MIFMFEYKYFVLFVTSDVLCPNSKYENIYWFLTIINRLNLYSNENILITGKITSKLDILWFFNHTQYIYISI